ncbi:hypothetical protein AN958_12806 [Leucoagaricus sp. SymC.cos]|nr:hypothetical protein AN958_12806 [Leucoagaricus sp. SymC.cos]
MDISDEDLDNIVAVLLLKNPLSGVVILHGHLMSSGILVPLAWVKASLKQVDPIGLYKWGKAIKWRVYHVHGSNALWHHDGNEKIWPWGFYVYRCVDGHSHLIIYLECCANKCAETVEQIFMEGVAEYGWPSHVCSDHGTENNGVEKRMIEKWEE